VLGFDSMRDVYEIRERTAINCPAVHPPGDLTVMENMRFFADLHGIPRKLQKSSIARITQVRWLTDFTSRRLVVFQEA